MDFFYPHSICSVITLPILQIENWATKQSSKLPLSRDRAGIWFQALYTPEPLLWRNSPSLRNSGRTATSQRDAWGHANV